MGTAVLGAPGAHAGLAALLRGAAQRYLARGAVRPRRVVRGPAARLTTGTGTPPTAPRPPEGGRQHLAPALQRLLPCGVIKFRYIWICWFAALAAGGAYIAGVSPRLRLPTLPPPRGQVFRPSHPFERFDAEYRQQFLFERLPQGEGGHMPVVLVWGILPVDTETLLDPRSNSSLVADHCLLSQRS